MGLGASVRKGGGGRGDHRGGRARGPRGDGVGGGRPPAPHDAGGIQWILRRTTSRLLDGSSTLWTHNVPLTPCTISHSRYARVSHRPFDRRPPPAIPCRSGRRGCNSSPDDERGRGEALARLGGE